MQGQRPPSLRQAEKKKLDEAAMGEAEKRKKEREAWDKKLAEKMDEKGRSFTQVHVFNM